MTHDCDSFAPACPPCLLHPQAQGVPGAHVSGKEFLRFWVHYSAGTISVGTGEPSLETLSYR